MSIEQVLGIGVLVVVGIYIVARLVTHAYFKSRDDYERKKQHERQKFPS